MTLVFIEDYGHMCLPSTCRKFRDTRSMQRHVDLSNIVDGFFLVTIVFCVKSSVKDVFDRALNTHRQCVIIIVSKSCYLKGTLSALRPFLATQSPLKIMKNAFYLNLKVH